MAPTHKIKLALTIIAVTTQLGLFAQQKVDNKAEIHAVLKKYSQSVIAKDSVTFYDLFNDGPVEWAGAIKDRSQAIDNKKNGPSTNYFSSSHKNFFRSLYKLKSSEDKFDNVQIIEDGTVASVTMNYSFWADGKMTNWGGKYLGLIKINGKWKITSIIYSIELTDYFAQPALKNRPTAVEKSNQI